MTTIGFFTKEDYSCLDKLSLYFDGGLTKFG